jgi:hypothetical protein
MRKASQVTTQSGVMNMFGMIAEPIRTSIGYSAGSVSSSSPSLLRVLLLTSP